MQLTYSNGPLPLQPRHTGAGQISRSHRFASPAILFLSFATLGATVSRAQDQQSQSVAEAARQERARKQEQQKTAKHVYTEEDLKHANILTPEDRAQIEAKKNECAQKNNCPPAAPQNPPAALDANSQTPGTSPDPATSLGEVARQLRKQRELQALKPKQTEPFHLLFSTPALASPILPERPAIRPPAQPVLRPKTKTPSNVFRRDPFSAVPVRPEVSRAEVPRTEVHADAHTAVPENIRPTVQPKVSNDVRPKVHEDVQPKLREEILPTVRPNVRPAKVPAPKVRPDFSKEVRPTLRAHGRLTIPAQPRISYRLAAPGIPLQPVQQPAPPKSAQPSALLAPISTTRPAQPQPVAKSPALVTGIATQKTVSVQPGDSLWKLAQQNLGRGNRWPKLLTVNPSIANPNQIRAGTELVLPTVAATPVLARIIKNTPAASIKVRKGDTLWNLAKANLGRSSAWPCLAAANPSLRDPNRIYEGQNLVLPSACSTTLAAPTSSMSRSTAARP
jgi:LysM repeat protein